jgi:hypothetical protein
MQSRYAPRVRLVPQPRRAELRCDQQSADLAARMRQLRSVLGSSLLPPPVVPLRAHILNTDRGQRLFLELRNLSGLFLDSLGVEAVLLDSNQRELDVMSLALSELAVAGDPRRIVPVGGWALDPAIAVAGATIRVLYARFSDGSSWDGELDTLEDPRLSDLERSRAGARFFAPYSRFLHLVEGQPAQGPVN